MVEMGIYASKRHDEMEYTASAKTGEKMYGIGDDLGGILRNILDFHVSEEFEHGEWD